MRTARAAFAVIPSVFCLPFAASAADLIAFNGRIVTVDADFSVAQAMAVQDGRIVAVGSNDEVLRLKDNDTEALDLEGRMVLPGLIDSHVHPCDAAMTEFDHPIPQMDSVADVLDYFRARADALDDGEWIVLQQVFITRLREQRYPTRAELDEAAPKNPAVFRTGPDASLNTLALRLSGIDRDFRVTDGGPGYAEKDPQTGELTGILRSCNRFIKSKPTGKEPTERDRYDRLRTLFQAYNAVGLTGICDGAAEVRCIVDHRRRAAPESPRDLVAKIVRIDDLPATVPRVQVQIPGTQLGHRCVLGFDVGIRQTAQGRGQANHGAVGHLVAVLVRHGDGNG